MHDILIVIHIFIFIIRMFGEAERAARKGNTIDNDQIDSNENDNSNIANSLPG